MRAITDAGGEHQCFDKLTEYRNAVDPVSSAELPGTESMAWLFDKHPPLATALNMIYAERCLHAKLSAAYMAWTTKDMHADVFLCDGYGKQLEELGAALTDAKRFKDGANEVILKLRGGSRRGRAQGLCRVGQVSHAYRQEFLVHPLRLRGPL